MNVGIIPISKNFMPIIQKCFQRMNGAMGTADM
jgi:hypothetical protein